MSTLRISDIHDRYWWLLGIGFCERANSLINTLY